MSSEYDDLIVLAERRELEAALASARHRIEEVRKEERERCARICDSEFAANWHSSAMAAANAAKRCAELIRANDKEHTRKPKEKSR